MAQFFTDFSEYTAGEHPPDWAASGSITWPVSVQDGDKAVVLPTVLGDQQVMWLDVPLSTADTDVAALVKLTGGSVLELALRLRGVTGTKHAYRLGLGSPTQLRIVKWVEGAYSVKATQTIASVLNQRVWLRAQAVGTILRLKYWPENDDEPGTWNLEVEDADIASGGVGLNIWTNSAGYVTSYGVGTDGDLAPRSASGTPEPVIHEVAAAEALSLTDGQAALAALYGARTEQVALSDALAALSVLNAQSADALSITDAIAAHAALQVQIAESLTLADTESASAILGAERSDTLALLATQTAGNVLVESITEALTLSESLQGDISLEVAIAESLALSDAASSQADLQATASEEISLVVSHIASALLHAGVTEIVSVTSSVSASVVSTAVSLPDGRTLTVRAENRILTVAAENRIKIAR